MLRMILFLVFFNLFSISYAVDFYAVLATVESGGDPSAIGDGGRSVGLYQISKLYVDDVNRIAGTCYIYDDRFDQVKSRKMVEIYLTHYGRRYTRLTGCAVTFDVLAAIHNGGPDGWRKHSTLKYRQKVRMGMCAYAKKTHGE